MQNPVTGSGGMLIGKVEKIGDSLKSKISLKEGDKIATLVSLSLTPLRIDKILDVNPDIDRVEIKGKAILFESGIYAKLPEDMENTLALAALDVAGAPAQVKKLVKPGTSILILGATGKSGLMCSYVAKQLKSSPYIWISGTSIIIIPLFFRTLKQFRRKLSVSHICSNTK